MTQPEQINRLSHEILMLRLKIAESERDIARKELELFKLASAPQPMPVIERGAFPKMVRDFMDTINGDSFRVQDVCHFMEEHRVTMGSHEKNRIRAFLSHEERNGRLCKTLVGYRKPT